MVWSPCGGNEGGSKKGSVRIMGHIYKTRIRAIHSTFGGESLISSWFRNFQSQGIFMKYDLGFHSPFGGGLNLKCAKVGRISLTWDTARFAVMMMIMKQNLMPMFITKTKTKSLLIFQGIDRVWYVAKKSFKEIQFRRLFGAEIHFQIEKQVVTEIYFYLAGIYLYFIME